MPDH